MTTTKVVRISPEAEAVAKQYGKTVGAGIMTMESKIASYALTPQTTLAYQTSPLVVGQPPTVSYSANGAVIPAATTAADRWRQSATLASDGSVRVGEMGVKEFMTKMRTEIDEVIRSYAGGRT